MYGMYASGLLLVHVRTRSWTCESKPFSYRAESCLELISSNVLNKQSQSFLSLQLVPSCNCRGS